MQDKKAAPHAGATDCLSIHPSPQRLHPAAAAENGSVLPKGQTRFDQQTVAPPW
jgi:hypothetical protein